jgi:hypothetical protein
VRFPWRTCHRAIDHLGLHFGGLAAFGSLFRSDLAFARDQFGVEFVGGQRQRERSGDVHRDLLAQRFEHVGTGFGFERDEHADLAEVRRSGIVHVGHDETVGHRNVLQATQLLVFTDGRDVVGQLVGNGAAVGIGSSLERFDVGRSRFSATWSPCARSPGTVRSWQRSRFPS